MELFFLFVRKNVQRLDEGEKNEYNNEDWIEPRFKKRLLEEKKCLGFGQMV